MPDEKTVYHQIIAIFIKQMYELLIDNAYKKTREYRFPTRINFLLDEFTSLPQMTDMPQMITASRSRNIRFMLVIQSKYQLKQRYKEEAETIMSNCSNWLFLTSRETELLREISELSGVTGSNREPLISVSRLQHLDKETGECLIFSGRKNPYFSHLPDIEEYDGNQYVVRPLPLRELPTISEEIFAKEFFFQELISPEQDDGSNETLSQPTFPELLGPSKDEKWPGRLSLDDYIAKLDKKIAELEAEEAAAKKEENRAGTMPSEEGSKA
jgi:type IV secretion system protein VirD4